MSECPVAVGDLVAGKYRVEGTLGQGGMGTVVLARHLELQRLVAIKFLQQTWASNPEASERFRREARAAARIQGEHVVQVLDVGNLAGGGPFIVLEHLEGRNLAEELEQRGRLPVALASDWLLQACQGLALAHASGIVHRDLKPENLFLTKRPDGSDLVKVMDFGISKSLAGDSSMGLKLTRTSVIVGSPMYMSPEQLESARQVDLRADLWSLGVVLHELLSGMMPFPGDTIPQLVRSILTQTRTPLTVTFPDLPQGLEAVVARCLAFNREHRFQSAWEVAQALKPFASAAGQVFADRVIRVMTADVRGAPPPPALGAPIAPPHGGRPAVAFTQQSPGPHMAAHSPSTQTLSSQPSNTQTASGIGAGPAHRGGFAQGQMPPPAAYAAASRQSAVPANTAMSHAAPAAHNVRASKFQVGKQKHLAILLAGAVAVLGVGAFFLLRGLADSVFMTSVLEKVGNADTVELTPARLDSFGLLPSSVNGPATNPTTAEKVELGRKLFHDPILSADKKIACSSCHDLQKYGMDGQRRSRGNGGQMGTRNTPSVYNVGNAMALMWDGRLETFEEQVLAPLHNPKEMGISEEVAIERLEASAEYKTLFAKAFPAEDQPITVGNLAKALSSFQRQLFTPNSPWDRYLNGDPGALSNEQREGFNAFVDVGCATCHFGPDLGLNLFQKAGLVKAWPNTRDRGRFEVTGRPSDFMVFRVPSLRNIAETGPYFHDGSVAELERAVYLMGRHQLGVKLDKEKVDSIVAWLKTLTGEIPVKLATPPALP